MFAHWSTISSESSRTLAFDACASECAATVARVEPQRNRAPPNAAKSGDGTRSREIDANGDAE
jgi:hypothetical protein|tara:strand:- start:251 stop:439 length:189 start_codon:yes stop_codon:yes gene_type:complete